MANTIQIKRGLEANRSSVTPAAGELLYTTDEKKVYIGDGTTAGGNPVAPAVSAGKMEATASGALADGSTVIVNADGTVSVVAGQEQVVGTEVAYETRNGEEVQGFYDPNTQQVVVVYIYFVWFEVVVGTVSGTSITFGPITQSAETVDKNGSLSAAYDAAAQKIVVSYRERNNDYGTAVVGTISGTSVTFGTPVVYNSAITFQTRCDYDANAQKIVIAYQDAGNSNYGTAIVGTVSGTSISFGTEVVFEEATTIPLNVVHDVNAQKTVIFYRDAGNSNYGTAIVGTVSGTSISFGTPVVYNSATTTVDSALYHPDEQKIVICPQFTQVIVGTVSGTSISFGAPVTLPTSIANVSICYDDNLSKIVMCYRVASTGILAYKTGSVVGTSVILDTEYTLYAVSSIYASIVYDASAQKTVLLYKKSDNNYDYAAVLQPYVTNMTAENFIGISDGAYADTATATVQIIGAVDDAQTGLTAGQTYYVQADGSLSTTESLISVFAGTAISATNIIVKG